MLAVASVEADYEGEGYRVNRKPGTLALAAGERHVRNVNIVASAPRVSGVRGCGYESAESADAEEVLGITQSAKKTGPDGHENGGTRTPASVLRGGEVSEACIREAR